MSLIPVDLDDPNQRYRVNNSSNIRHDIWAGINPFQFGKSFSAAEAEAAGFKIWVRWPDGSGDPGRLNGLHRDGRSFGATVLDPSMYQELRPETEAHTMMQGVLSDFVKAQAAAFNKAAEQALRLGCGIRVVYDMRDFTKVHAVMYVDPNLPANTRTEEWRHAENPFK